MAWILSVVLLLLFICGVSFLLHEQQAKRRAAPNSPLTLEYRTDYALDECLDFLRKASERDIFLYTFEREQDGSFSLHFTMHRPTSQPVDTLYSLRLDSGRQTVISLHFIREAFGYQEPVFPLALLDEFFATKLQAYRSMF